MYLIRQDNRREDFEEGDFGPEPEPEEEERRQGTDGHGTSGGEEDDRAFNPFQKWVRQDWWGRWVSPMQRAAPQTKAGCNFRHQQKRHQKREGTTPNYQLTTPPKSTRPDQFQKQKKRGKEYQLAGTITTMAKQEEAKANKTTNHRIQNSKASETKDVPTLNGRPRKTLAPFKKISQDINLRKSQERQCQEADQTIVGCMLGAFYTPWLS